MTLEKLDHLVLPVSDIDAIAMFYTTYLGMEKRIFGDGRSWRVFPSVCWAVRAFIGSGAQVSY
ncbi:MAG: VOC family protein [bacterium]